MSQTTPAALAPADSERVSRELAEIAATLKTAIDALDDAREIAFAVYKTARDLSIATGRQAS